MTDTTKKCSKCGEVKLLGEFHKNKTMKCGYSCYCKKCAYEVKKEWRKKNYWHEYEVNKLWRKANPEKCKATREKYVLNNLEKVRAGKRKWNLNNSEKMKECRKSWVTRHPKRVSEIRRKAKKIAILKITDCYVKHGWFRRDLTKEIQIPKSLIDLKREQLKLTRLIKEKQK